MVSLTSKLRTFGLLTVEKSSSGTHKLLGCQVSADSLVLDASRMGPNSRRLEIFYILVSKALPTFEKALGDRLRTPEQGADTIIWAAASEQVKTLQNGSFLFDRAIATQHLTFAGTQSADEDVERLVKKLDGYIEATV